MVAVPMRLRAATLLASLLGVFPALAADAGVAPLRFVLTPYQTPDELKAHYRPLADRLAAKLQQPVELIVADDFGKAADMLVDGRADVAEVTPYAFVAAMRRARLSPIVADAMLGRPGTGVIIVSAASKVKALEDLKGTSFGFVDQFSSTGFLGPWAMLQVKGLRPSEFFSKWTFLGSHSAVIDAVLKGTVDAGAVSRHSVDTEIAEKRIDASKLRVVMETARMPGDVVCGRADLPAATRDLIEKELLALDWNVRADRAVLEPMLRKKYEPVDVNDYGWLLRVASSIKK